MPEKQDFSLLTPDQLKYLARQVLDAAKQHVTELVAATPSRMDDIVWGMVERWVLTDKNLDRIIDIVAGRLAGD